MENNVEALIIGCGNIGGLYDLHCKEKVWTHAKAFSLNKKIHFSVYDPDESKAETIAEAYGVPVIKKLTDEEISKYAIVSITSPTTTHYPILQQLIKVGTPTIICEKPVSSNHIELKQLVELYQQGKSKILVNYIRRFQPAYSDLKKVLPSWDDGTGLKNIIIKYQRGFLNNASHAVDLLEYLFDSPMLLNDIKIISAPFDAFEYDATITGAGTFLNRPLLFAGVTEADYTIFEIELFFSNSKIVICHSGNDIRYYKKSENKQLIEALPLRKENILNQYMKPVVDKALAIFDGIEKDNFLSSVAMNLRLLNATGNLINLKKIL
jgi:hypothetical protein